MTPGKQEVLWEKLVELKETPGKGKETPEKRGEPFFINGYLLLYEPLTIEEGLSGVWEFLDDYYFRKCAGTEETRKEMAISIKKFYRCMKDHGKISETYFDILCDDIKEVISQPMQESY